MEGTWEFGTYQASRLKAYYDVIIAISGGVCQGEYLEQLIHDLWFQLSILQQTSNTQIKFYLPLCESPLCLSNPRQGNFWVQQPLADG